MNDPLDQRIIELGWRQQLTKAEGAQLRAHLSAHPETRERLESEMQLTRLLEKTPEAPRVASNFTAQVMQAIEREQAAKERKVAVVGQVWWRLRGWLPRATVAALVGGFSLLGVYEHGQRQRALMAERIGRMARVYATVGGESVDHFDQIQRYADAPPAADTELSALVASIK